MIIKTTPLEGILLIKPRVFVDERGFFLETFQAGRFREHGLPETFVQDNWSRSPKGIIRGLHYQVRYPQGKLIFVVSGLIYDVAVDIRSASSTYGQWYGVYLDGREPTQVYIPPGFAHGFCVISEQADFMYKCTDYYHAEDEGGLVWNDPDICIQWPLSDPILSEKDARYPRLKNIQADQLPQILGKGIPQ